MPSVCRLDDDDDDEKVGKTYSTIGSNVDK